MHCVKIIVLPLLFLALLTGCQKPPETAESVLQKVVRAHGGEKALREAQGLLFHGHIQALQEEDHGKLWILYRRPMQLRVAAEWSATKEDRLYANGEGWVDVGKGFTRATGMVLDLMKFQAEHLDLPFGLLEMRYQAELSEEIVADKSIKLRLVDSNGVETTIGVDPGRWVIRLVERELLIQGTKISFSVVYEDYRTVKGVQLPFRVLNYVNGQPVGRTTFQSVQTNPSLPENLFSAPGKGAG